MGIKRKVEELQGTSLFSPGVSLYVNRALETFQLTEHRHDFIELTYVSEGSGTHYIGGEVIPVTQGDVFFIPVGVSHVFRPSTPERDKKLVVYNCVFPPEYVKQLQSMFPDAERLLAVYAEPSSSWRQARDPGEFHGWFKELYREYAAMLPGGKAVLTSIVLRILIGFHRLQHSAEGPAASSGWYPLDQAIAYIDSNYAGDVTLKELASQMKLSERQFSRLFLKQTGMNYSTYLQNVRMDAACRLLRSSDRSIRDISSAVGYADLKFFHRLFKRKTGVTPTSYRKK
ncbi:AraC family transcriptional regulator [Paenibacillus silviterrae]|uniref:AraC family transcriptional regulator n=1 Tax=Paenibacillus silviterrae TaxID=3242194 RepID=UPI0025437B08|nr:AraC family transcriptional regulator [Paenibacillus chinjuensis]